MRNSLRKSVSYIPSEGEQQPDESPHSSNARLRLVVLLFILLYCVSFAVQIKGLILLAPAPDEVHWSSRSATLLSKIKARKFEHLTSHLPHPGIPGSYAMASGQVLANKFNAALALDPGQRWYFDSLSGSRLGAILVASCFAPLVFIFATFLFGLRTSFFTAALLSLDPYVVAVSRQAHIDATLAMLMCLSAFSFIYAVKKNSLKFQLSAAIFWGLSLAAKPTAVLLLPAFALVRLLQFFTTPNKRLFYWRDVWSVVIGLSVFSLLYTRLWHYWTNESFKLNPWRGAPVWSDSLAPFFVDRAALSVGCFSILLCALVGFELKFGKLLSAARKVENLSSRLKIQRHLLHLALLMGYLALILAIRPEILKNLTGYTGWVFGLADTPHFAYGRVWAPPPYGYAGLVFGKLPTFILLGIALSLLFLFFVEKQTRNLALMLIVFIGCVTGGLSVSGKQAYRYLLPIVPFLYLISVCGFSYSLARLKRSWITSAVLSLILAWQAINLSSWQGAEQLFHNSLSGGLAAAMERGRAQAFVGQNDIIDWLQKASEEEERSIRVGVVGDFRTLKHGYHRVYPKVIRTKNSEVQFRNWSYYDSGEYVVIYHSMLRRMGKAPIAQELEEPVFRVVVDDVAVASIYRPIAPGESTPVTYKLAELLRATGRIAHDRLIAEPGKHKRGYIYYDSYVRVLPGSYQFELEFEPKLSLEGLDTSRLAIRPEFGSKCHKPLTVGDLKSANIHKFSCDFDRELYLQVRAFWFGYAPISLDTLKISRLPAVEKNK